jgi:hypothetical protein
MTSIGTLNAANRTQMSVIQPRCYFSNDFDKVKAWDGVWSAVRDSGIAAPSAAPGAATQASGNVTVGTHLIGYYYRDSTSPGGESEGYGYRSSLSPVSTETVSSSAQKLTFSVSDAGIGGDIIRSADPKVDTIVLCATLAGGEAFFIVEEIANAGVTTVDYNVSDTVLTQYTSLTSVGGTSGHDQPPCTASIAVARNVTFYGVQFDADVTVSVTNGSATVSGTFSEMHAGRLFTRTGDTKSYRIAAVASGGASLTLSETYAGVTGASVAARITSNNPSRVWYSTQYYPESCDLASKAFDTMDDVDDRLRCMTSYLGDPWFLGYRTAQRLIFNVNGGDLVDYDLVTMSGTCGAWNRFCVVKPSADSLYCWGPNGVWVLSGGRPTIISGQIDDDWRAVINYSEAESIHGWYDPEENEVGWMFCSGSSSVPNRALMYDIDGRRWRIDVYRQGMDCSTLYTTSNGRLQCVLADSTNEIAFTRGGSTDGVPTGTGKYTVAAGTTTTVTNVSDSLPTGAKGTGFDGLVAYSPDLDEAVAISDNAAGSITHAAFSSALTPGQKVYVGSIPVVVEFSWWPGQDQSIEKVPEKLLMYAVPSSTATELRLYQYRDFSTSEVTVADIAGRTYPKGVTVNNDRDGFLIDMSVADGYIEVPCGATAAKVLKVKLTLDDPSGEFTLLDVQWKEGDRSPGGDGE